MKSDFRQRLHDGECVLGTMLSEVSTPNVVRILHACGFEFLLVDCEHGYFDLSQTAAIVSVCGCLGMPVIIRIPEAGRELVTKYMDMGATGLLLSMTSTPEQAKQLVKYAKYAPLGQRGISVQRAHTGYNPPPLSQYIKEANDRTVLFVQIETREGIKNIEDILSIDGIDGAMIGPNDMAGDFGCPGQIENPEVEDGISKVLSTALHLHKPCGIISSNIQLLNKWHSRGMTILSCNSEVGMMLKAGKEIVKEIAAFR